MAEKAVVPDVPVVPEAPELPVKDVFIPPKPYNSWKLNEDSCLWESPVPYPQDNKMYYWNEEEENWFEIEIVHYF